MIHWLDRVVAEEPNTQLPVPETKEAMQRVTRQAAFEPESWTPERAAKVTALFDELAAGWNTRYSAVSRYESLDDALERGDPGRGRCLEVGSGTGLVTPRLAARFDAVVGLDLSPEMLRQGSGARVQADANLLPLRDASFDSAVLVNAILFPREIARVLAPIGTVVWVNTRGADTPIHLPPEDVVAALGPGWTGVAAHAGLGTWCVARRG